MFYLGVCRFYDSCNIVCVFTEILCMLVFQWALPLDSKSYIPLLSTHFIKDVGGWVIRTTEGNAFEIEADFL